MLLGITLADEPLKIILAANLVNPYCLCHYKQFFFFFCNQIFFFFFYCWSNVQTYCAYILITLGEELISHTRYVHNMCTEGPNLSKL